MALKQKFVSIANILLGSATQACQGQNLQLICLLLLVILNAIFLQYWVKVKWSFLLPQ